MLHDQALRSDNVKISIIEPLDINAYLPYPTEEMITVGDFIAWLIGFFACLGMLSKWKYKFCF